MSRHTAPIDDLRPALGEAKANALKHAWITGTNDDREQITVMTDLMRDRLQRHGMPLLLPPPGQHRTVPGGIALGRAVHGRMDLGPVSVSPRELTTHMCILGRSGSGKTTLALRMLLQLSEQATPWIAIDSKRALRQVIAMDLPSQVHVLALGRSLPARLRFNPLCPPHGVPPETHFRQVLELVCRAWGAGDAVNALLNRVMQQYVPKGGITLDQTQWPTINDVRKALVQLPLASREATWRQTALRVLDQLTTGPLGGIFNDRTDAVAVDLLLEQHTILETDGLTGTDSAFLVHALLLQVTPRLHVIPTEHKQPLRLALFLDEAHRLLARHEGGRESPMELLLREGRSLGLGIMLASQTFAGISTTALANCATTIVMQCRFKADMNTAAQTLMLKDEDKDAVGSLDVGEAIMRLGSRWPHPFMLSVAPLELPATPVTDVAINHAFLVGPFRKHSLAIRHAVEVAHAPQIANSPRSMQLEYELMTMSQSSQSPSDDVEHSQPFETSRPEPVVRDAGDSADFVGSVVGTSPDASRGFAEAIPRPDHPQLERVQDAGIAPDPKDDHDDLPGQLMPEAIRLLGNVAQHPITPVTMRYEQLRLSRRKGDVAKRFLVAHDFLKPVEVPTPEGKVMLLALSDKAKDYLRRRRVTIAPLRASLPHEYWQHRIASQLRNAGFEVELEWQSGGHTFDIFATKGTTGVLLEVETGKSAIQLNLIALANARADHKAMLWLDASTFDRTKAIAHQQVTLLQPRDVASWFRSITD